MKLSDLKIGTQIRLGMGVVLAFVAVLGGLAWVQSNQIWQETKGLYEHPLTVRRAIGELQADILSMHRAMTYLCLETNDAERQITLQSIDTFEVNAQQQITVIYDSYLGSRNDIDDVAKLFAQWKSFRVETIQLLREGKIDQATKRVKISGEGGKLVEVLLGHVRDISDFAMQRGDKFYSDATQHKAVLTMRLGITVGIIFMLSVFVGYLLMVGIRSPLRELTVVADQYRQGKMDARSHYESANELGALSAAFNQMASAVETNMHLNKNIAKLSSVMLREEELHAFCRDVLVALLEQTGSQVGAVYLLNEQKTAFEHFESIGLGSVGQKSFSVKSREGEIGAALATRKIRRVTDIPADSRFTFAAVSGDFAPREIITIPILTNEHVAAVISLASVRNYSELTIRLLDEVWGVLTARMNGVLALRKLREFSEKMENQNRELDAQKRELQTQADELTEQNTELEMQKHELDEANRLKSVFLSNMSHELRTPLNSVIALSGVLNRRLAKTVPAEEYSYLEIIERNGKHLLALINDILDLSRIESGREELSLTSFPIRTLVDEVVTLLEPQAREKQITLLNEMDETLPSITSDFMKCRHILQNLVGNAVKFTEQGQVAITAEAATGFIHISVTDTGIGISADQLGHIFDEFRQGDESTSRKYGGTGLGLAIAKKFATLLQGTITVKSLPGRGSTFTLQIPLELHLSGAAAAPHPAPTTARIPLVLPDGCGRKILLVEDSEPAIIQIKDILIGQGYQVSVARNGREGLEQIAKAIPDAMILDLMMPEVDGFTVLNKLRGTKETAQLPVLILTAKYLSKAELSDLNANHIYQLIQKGDVSRVELLAAVTGMVTPLQKKPAPLAKKAACSPRRAGKPIILVVEDNPDNMATLQALLKETYTLLEAADGQVGIEQARRHKPDLILMDVALPVMDGIEALVVIRADAALSHIPVIAVTASAMKGNREEILAHGFNGYVSKPIDYHLLEQAIREVLV